MVVEKSFTLLNENGLHARPATKIAELVAKFNSKVMVKCNGMEVDAKRVINLLMLGAECGMELSFKIDGQDAENLMTAIGNLINQKFLE